MQPELDRGYVQRVRFATLAGPAGAEVTLFEIRIPGETVHLVCAAGLGVGILDPAGRSAVRDAMRGEPLLSGSSEPLPRLRLRLRLQGHAQGDARVWRAQLEGSSIVKVTLEGLMVTRDGRAIVIESSRGRPGEPIAIAIEDEPVLPGEPATREALAARGPAIAGALARGDTDGRREAFGRDLRKAIARLERRAAAVAGDLARIEAAGDLALRAQTFVASAAAAPRGAERLRAVDWSSGEARDVELAIDPAKGAREQIDALFKRARRLKEGGQVARARRDEAGAALATLRAVLDEATRATPGGDLDLDALAARARAAAPRDVRIGGEPSASREGRASPGQPRRLPYRSFAGASGARILVGRGAAENDALTLHVARPHDLWLHARDTTGAHVIVPLAKGASCPPDWLAEAAHLAAHFSDAREERLVDVVYTPRRYLRKPRGSAPGLVVVDREKVFVLRKDDRVLARLLEAEVL
ncbi:MAG TPA: NFACT RNA binding domain-containing protein [Polyangiaceae bacterium]|jgi:hypothetical protein|nr:NFACT RNA binding domain-containing protein [Polyangiaceae bacterium]